MPTYYTTAYSTKFGVAGQVVVVEIIASENNIDKVQHLGFQLKDQKITFKNFGILNLGPVSNSSSFREAQLKGIYYQCFDEFIYPVQRNFSLPIDWSFSYSEIDIFEQWLFVEDLSPLLEAKISIDPTFGSMLENLVKVATAVRG